MRSVRTSADDILTQRLAAATIHFRVRVAQARQQHEHVLAITCKTFGADHPHTITPLHNAGLMTWAMGARKNAFFCAIFSLANLRFTNTGSGQT